MSKQFVEGNVYVFTIKKFKKDTGLFSVSWAKDINGREVRIRNEDCGKCGSFGVLPKWCKCISNKSKPRTKPLSIDEIRELDEKLCEYCKCTFYGLEMGFQHVSTYSSGCEGAYCEEAYEYYLDNFEEGENEQKVDYKRTRLLGGTLGNNSKRKNSQRTQQDRSGNKAKSKKAKHGKGISRPFNDKGSW